MSAVVKKAFIYGYNLRSTACYNGGISKGVSGSTMPEEVTMPIGLRKPANA